MRNHTARQTIWGLLIVIFIGSAVFLKPGLFSPVNMYSWNGVRTLLQPAAFTSLVWIVIYAGLFFLGIWLLLPEQKTNPRAIGCAPWLALGAAGILLRPRLAGDGKLIIPALLVLVFTQYAVWKSYFALGVGSRFISKGERWLHIPLQVCAGKLAAETFTAAAAALKISGWTGWGLTPSVWAMIVIAAAGGLALYAGIKQKDKVFEGVFVWAFVGIAAERQNDPEIFAAAAVTAVVVFLHIFFAGKIGKLVGPDD